MFGHTAGRPMLRLLRSGGFSSARQRLPLAVRSSSSSSDQALHRPVRGGQDSKEQEADCQKTNVPTSTEEAGKDSFFQADTKANANHTNLSITNGSSRFTAVSSDGNLNATNSVTKITARDGIEVVPDIYKNNIKRDPVVRNQLQNSEEFEKSTGTFKETDFNSKSSAQPSIPRRETSSETRSSFEASENSLSSPHKVSLPTTNSSNLDVPQTGTSHQINNSSSSRGSEDLVASSSSGPSNVNNTGHVSRGSPGPSDAPTVSETALATVPKPKGVLGYIISRYTWYVEHLQKSLETEMPKTFKMFRIFSVGLKSFTKDFTGYVRVLVVLSFPSQRMEGLSLRDLELYHFMPWDMVKVFPVLLISAIPLGQNMALPLGYLFPRQLLCRHFWDLQQTHDFSMRYLRSRVYNARPVFRNLQAPLESIEPLPARVRAQSAWHKLGSGVHPSREEVLAMRPLFAEHPFSIQTIRRHHRNALLRLHGLSAPLGGRRRLREHARWLLCHDRALTASGDETTGDDRSGATLDTNKNLAADGSHSFTMDQTRGLSGEVSTIHTDGTVPSLINDSITSADDDLLLATLTSLHVTTLKTSLLLRGISPIGLDSSGMTEILLRWLTVSRHFTKEDYSLLLHLPVLLFYNHPTNLALIAPHTRF